MSGLRCGTAEVWKLLSLVTLLIIVFSGSKAEAQGWVASTGAVDEGSLSTYQFTGGNAFLRPSVANGFAILRYNVTPFPTDKLTEPCCEGWNLIVRFQDNGSAAQVLVSLKGYNVKTGKVSTLITFDSNNFPAQSGFREPLPNDCGSFFNFDFVRGGEVNGGEDQRLGQTSYYLEAKLIRSGTGGNPGLATIGIVKSVCP
jgi:hypothetical protein